MGATVIAICKTRRTLLWGGGIIRSQMSFQRTERASEGKVQEVHVSYNRTRFLSFSFS